MDTTNLRDNEGILSPPTIVPPLLRCGESVTVKGFVSGARIRIYVGGSELVADVGWDPDGHTVRLPRQLAEHEIVTATQQVSGSVESGPSPEERVVDYLAAFRGGLPQPRLPYLPLYNCGVATVVDQLPSGGKVTVFDQVNRGDPRTILGSINGVAAGQSIGVGPPFVQNHWVSAQSEICGVPSIFSTEQQVQAAPTTIPAPQVTGLYENGAIITVNQLVNGARVTISAGGAPIGGGGAPAEHVRFGLSRQLINGERVDITQELCPGTIGTGGGTVQPCSALPAPRIAAPWPGDEVIHVINPVPGSRIRVYVGGSEIGDGGGTEIRLVRPLVDGEEVIVTQSLGSCLARMGWRVRVGRGLDDPTASGPCSAEPFEYGHRNDGDRRTTDISAYFNSLNPGVGIRADAVPLHAVARVPTGPGPFPLVLIVHGNHDPLDASYPGYDYLLDLLASHCMIAVSVDEDFLNSPAMRGEMDARGIVLLRHLQLWREWNQTPGHRFFGKVDMNRIGLAGHSRGGEAIVAAHLLNVRDHRPAEPLQNFGFNIRALYSIAPVDGQFDGGPITLQGGADYYSMHGSHDGDVFDFGGLRMYNRAYPVNNPTSNVKGFVFVHGANHGQWNSTWETCCEQGLAPLPFPLISSNDQKQIGKAYMSAFFRMSLQGNVGFKHFLNGDAGFASLPAAVTRVFQYQDPQRTFIDHYQEDTDSATGSLTGTSNSTAGTFASHSNLTFRQEDPPDFLWGETNGLLLKWEGGANPEYRVNVADRLSALPNYRYLAFHAGQTHEEPRRFNDPAANQDFSVQLQFGATAGPEVMISSYALLRYPALTGPWIHPFTGERFNTKKSILRTVRIPFADLRPDPRLRLRDVTVIIFRFNRRASGSIAIDEIQFTD